MIYDYITTKPPLDENTMSEYGLTYLEHGRMKGWVAATHKYLDRVWKNGKWVYSYAKKAGSGALRTAKSTAKNFTKSLSKSTNSGLNRLGSMMDRIRKRYGGGNAKATFQNTLNTAKKEGKYLATKTKNAAKKAYSEAKSTAKQAKVSAQNATNTAKKEGKYLATKTKNAAKKAYSEAKSTAKQAKVSAQNATNMAKKEGKYLATKAKNNLKVEKTTKMNGYVIPNESAAKNRREEQRLSTLKKKKKDLQKQYQEQTLTRTRTKKRKLK